MRAYEFLKETASAGAVSAGSVAVLSQPLGTVITRVRSAKPAKYRNSAPEMKWKQNASG